MRMIRIFKQKRSMKLIPEHLKFHGRTTNKSNKQVENCRVHKSHLCILANNKLAPWLEGSHSGTSLIMYNMTAKQSHTIRQEINRKWWPSLQYNDLFSFFLFWEGGSRENWSKMRWEEILFPMQQLTFPPKSVIPKEKRREVVARLLISQKHHLYW